MAFHLLRCSILCSFDLILEPTGRHAAKLPGYVSTRQRQQQP